MKIPTIDENRDHRREKKQEKKCEKCGIQMKQICYWLYVVKIIHKQHINVGWEK